MNIDIKVEEYKKSISKINEKRERWNIDTKEGIFRLLNALKENIDLDMGVSKNEEFENLQSVYLEFNKSPTGITKIEGAGGKHFVKHGGALLFSQSYNGNINIVIIYPYVEEWVCQNDPKYLKTLSPFDITPQSITEYVELFIDEMTEWENSYALRYAPIGFRK